MQHSSDRENQRKLTTKEISTSISSILSLVNPQTNRLSRKSSTSVRLFFPPTTGSRHPNLTFAPAHIVDDAFSAPANDFEETNILINSHSYNDNSGNQGGNSDTCDLLGYIPAPLTVLQSWEVQFSKDVQFGICPGVEVLSLIQMCAGTLRALVTNEQEATDGLAVKVEVMGMQGSLLTDNGNMLHQPKPKAREGVEGGNS